MISGWDVSRVEYMNFMFNGCNAFNGPIGGWNVSKVKNMTWMFNACPIFNGPIGGWNVGQVTTMAFMFNGCSAFNGAIGGWDVSQVTTMASMLRYNSIFNQDISQWNVVKVTNMNAMFQYANFFNQNLGQWNITSLTSAGYMFNLYNTGNGMDIANFSATLIGWAARGTTLKTSVEFIGAYPFSQIYSQAQSAYDFLKSNRTWVMDTYTFITTPPLVLKYNVPTTREYIQGMPILPYCPTLLGSYSTVVFSEAPSLPTGLTRNAVGAISGTPIIASPISDYNITCTAYDSNNSVIGTTQITLTFSVGGIVYSPSIYSLLKNTALFAPINLTRLDVGAVSCTINPTISPGLSFNTTTGAITGTPSSAADTTTYTVRANTTGGNQFSTTITLTVADINYAITPFTYLTDVSINVIHPTVFSYLYNASFSFNKILPSGLKFYPATGDISGIPLTTGSDTYTLTVSTASNYSNQFAFPITVADISYAQLNYTFLNKVPLLDISCVNIADLRGSTLAFDKPLPPGLALNPLTGNISGTPIQPFAANTYTLTISTSSNYQKPIPFQFAVADISYAQQNYTFLTDVPLLDISCVNIADLRGSTLAFDKPLPPGLGLNPLTGNISGTPIQPSAPVTYTLTISTSSNYHKSIAPFQFTIADISYAQLQYVFLADLPFPVISCITVAYLYGSTLAFDTLPQGLLFNPLTGDISGKPIQASAPNTYTLTLSSSSNYQKPIYFQFAVADISYNPVPYVYLQNKPDVYSPNSIGGIKPTIYQSNDLFESLLFSPALPPNLSISLLDGTISGIPNFAMEAQNYTLYAVTKSGYTKSLSINIMVEGINYNPDDSPPIYTFYLYDNVNINIAENIGGYTNFTVTPDLPWGIGLDSKTGALTGSLRYAPYDYSITFEITGYRNPSVTILLTINAINQFPQPCQYRCPPPVIIPRQIDMLNTQAIRFSSIVRRGLGQTRFISNSGNNINRTYQEPARNQF